jgi:hypothetical protein
MMLRLISDSSSYLNGSAVTRNCFHSRAVKRAAALAALPEGY